MSTARTACKGPHTRDRFIGCVPGLPALPRPGWCTALAWPGCADSHQCKCAGLQGACLGHTSRSHLGGHQDRLAHTAVPALCGSWV